MIAETEQESRYFEDSHGYIMEVTGEPRPMLVTDDPASGAHFSIPLTVPREKCIERLLEKGLKEIVKPGPKAHPTQLPQQKDQKTLFLKVREALR